MPVRSVRHFSLAFGATLALLIAATAAAEDAKPLVAHELATNDYSLDDKPDEREVPIPPEVAEVVRRVAQKDRAEFADDCPHELTAFRVRAPRGRFLYVAPFRSCFGGYIHFILWDPSSGAVTKVPPRIESHWNEVFGVADDYLKPPLVHFEDLDGDGTEELVVAERAHAGTVWNAMLHRYFEVGPRLELTHVFVIENRALHSTPSEGGELQRSVRRLGRQRLEVRTVDVSEDGRATAKRVHVLEREGRGAPFHVACGPSRTQGVSLSQGEFESDDAFLRGDEEGTAQWNGKPERECSRP